MKKLAVFLLFWASTLSAQWQLSDQAEIRVLTCGPYQGELYSAFGHSAVRVYDPVHGYDLLYNYGIFDFDQPNFYLNFARGHMLYQLDATSYGRFRDYYISENRFIHEQILNLNSSQKQAYFNFLQINAQPENKMYHYDYFYDNCATRVRDGLIAVLGDSLQFNFDYVETQYTIRDLCDLYLQEQPWGDLGIDLCLGLPMDKEATPFEYMFLPDYVEKSFEHAKIVTPTGHKPLVRETVITYSEKPQPEPRQIWTPLFASSLLLVLVSSLSFLALKMGFSLRYFDLTVFTVIGMVGCLLFALWFFTDHKAAAQNFNLLWAIPFHFPVALFLFKKKPPRWLGWYFQLSALWYFLVLVLWFALPQDLHLSLLPLTILLALRSFLRGRNIRKS